MADPQFSGVGFEPPPSFPGVQAPIAGGGSFSLPPPLNVPSSVHAMPATGSSPNPQPQYVPQPPPSPQQTPGTAPQPQPSPAPGPAVPEPPPGIPSFASPASVLQQQQSPAGPPPVGQPPQPGVPGQPPTAEQVGSFRDALQASGFDVSPFANASDSDIVQYLVGQHRVAAHELPRVQQYADVGRQVLSNWDAWQEFQKTRNASPTVPSSATPGVPAAQAAPETAKDWWPAPPELSAYDRAIVAAYERNELPKEQVPVETIARLQARAAWERDRQEALLRNPVEAVMPGLMPKLQEQFATKKDIQAAIQELINDQFVNSWAAANEGLFYERDPQSGQFLVDPTTGQRRMSSYGQRYGQTIQMLEHADLSSPVVVARLAQMIVGQPPSAVPPGTNGNGAIAPQQTPQPVPQPVPQPTPQQQFTDLAQQNQANFPGFPTPQRGGFAGQPGIENPQILAAPRLMDVAQELHGRPW